MFNIKKYKLSEFQNKFDNVKPDEVTRQQITPKKSINGVVVRQKHMKELEVLYSDHCKEVNKKFDRLSKSNPNKYDHQERLKALKRCEECKDFINSEKTILCDICDDAYHTYCLGHKAVPKEKFVCPKCNADQKVTYKQSMLAETMNITIKKRDKVI
jgi:hypothetical protein